MGYFLSDAVPAVVMASLSALRVGLYPCLHLCPVGVVEAGVRLLEELPQLPRRLSHVTQLAQGVARRTQRRGTRQLELRVRVDETGEAERRLGSLALDPEWRGGIVESREGKGRRCRGGRILW
jgi:hypothetical protein